MRFGSLFSGVGGFDLGLERAGFECAWQVEIDPQCRAVLRRHWPDVDLYEDVRNVGRANLAPVELICGGFPCPVVSQAARGRNRTEWLWPQFARVLSEMRPAWTIIENVEGLRYAGRGLENVLRDLAALGYDATWTLLPASLFGAPHRRARLWVVAYPDSHSQPDLSFDAEASVLPQPDGADRSWPDPPRDLRMDDGLPGWVDRRAMMGNAVVPKMSEWIGRRLKRAIETPTVAHAARP